VTSYVGVADTAGISFVIHATPCHALNVDGRSMRRVDDSTADAHFKGNVRVRLSLPPL